ncbi:MAG: hypothetical protein IKU06_05995 [Lachnospiraceae bacterium]|nr:hypothetical protein [Lachnospiraceae bacterium]
MIKKHLIVASMVIVSICSCLVVGKNMNAVLAKENNGISSGVIAYEKGDPAWAEIAKEHDIESLKNDPCDELTLDLVDDSDYSKAEVEAYLVGDETFIAPTIDQDAEIDHLQEVRGNTIPTLFKNLSNGAYHYSITNMQSFVYTNYYFNVNSQGMIIMSLDSFNSGGHNITIRCYEVGSNNEVHAWTCNPELYSGVAWPGLDQNKLYYFKFEISGGTLSGSGSIYH